MKQLQLTFYTPAQQPADQHKPTDKHKPADEYRPALKDFPISERPTQRLQRYGPGALATGELYAILAGGPQQIEAMRALMSYSQQGPRSPIANLATASIEELQQLTHIGPSTAARLKAAFELGRRLVTETPEDHPQIASPADAANLVLTEMGLLDHEEFRTMILDTKNRVLEILTIYKGTIDTNLIRIAELFRRPITVNAPAIVLIHNHPSGDPTPSPEDIRTTERIVEAGKLMDVDIIDHLIIGRRRYVSLKERRLGFP